MASEMTARGIVAEWIEEHCDYTGNPDVENGRCLFDMSKIVPLSRAVEAAILAAVVAEREACAKAAELDGFAGNRHRYARDAANDIATVIRARKD